MIARGLALDRKERLRRGSDGSCQGDGGKGNGGPSETLDGTLGRGVKGEVEEEIRTGLNAIETLEDRERRLRLAELG